MTCYELWFKYGAPNKTPCYLLAAILQEAGLLTLTNNKGAILCELKTMDKDEIQKPIDAYFLRSLFSRLLFHYKAVRQWRNVKPLEGLSEKDS